MMPIWKIEISGIEIDEIRGKKIILDCSFIRDVIEDRNFFLFL